MLTARATNRSCAALSLNFPGNFRGNFPGNRAVNLNLAIVTLAIVASTLLCSRAACAAPPLAAPSLSAHSPVRLLPVADRLRDAAFVQSAHDGSQRLFIGNRDGRIFVVRPSLSPGKSAHLAGRDRRPFLDLRRLVSRGDRRGLLALTFHPHFRDNGRFFVTYTDTVGDLVAVEYRAAPGGEVADPNSGTRLLCIEQTYGAARGGTAIFGPDGYLYLAVGDSDRKDGSSSEAQDLRSLRGKILRIDVDHAAPYTVPADNPFIGRPDARPEIWAYGLANPGRFSFDGKSGRLFVSDTGRGEIEEVSIVEPGKNYGWSRMEGTRCIERDCSIDDVELPIFDYGRPEGSSVAGGFVYRGASLPELDGAYVFGDSDSGVIWQAREVRNASGMRKWQRERLVTESLPISSFAEDEQGELLVLDSRGGLFRLVPGAVFQR